MSNWNEFGRRFSFLCSVVPSLSLAPERQRPSQPLSWHLSLSCPIHPHGAECMRPAHRARENCLQRHYAQSGNQKRCHLRKMPEERRTSFAYSECEIVSQLMASLTGSRERSNRSTIFLPLAPRATRSLGGPVAEIGVVLSFPTTIVRQVSLPRLRGTSSVFHLPSYNLSQAADSFL